MDNKDKDEQTSTPVPREGGNTNTECTSLAAPTAQEASQNAVQGSVRYFAHPDVMNAWAHLRNTNSSIPDDALDDMRDVLLASLATGSTSSALAESAAFRALNAMLAAFRAALEPYRYDSDEEAIAKVRDLVRADVERRTSGDAAQEVTQQAETAEQAMIDVMPKRAAFLAWAKERALDVTEDKEAWGKRKFFHSHVQALWDGWFHAPATYAMPEQANVLPYKQMPDSELQQVLLAAAIHPNEPYVRAAARAMEAELARRFRAQGGVTNANADSSDLAPTTSTVSAPEEVRNAVPVISSYDLEKVKSLKYKFVDELIHSGVQYRTCGAISSTLNRIIDDSEKVASAALRTTSGKGEAA